MKRAVLENPTGKDCKTSQDGECTWSRRPHRKHGPVHTLLATGAMAGMELFLTSLFLKEIFLLRKESLRSLLSKARQKDSPHESVGQADPNEKTVA